jgi:hypothetical protein
MSELAVGSIAGLASNGFVVDVASGSSLDLSNGATLPAGSVLQVVSTTKTDAFTASVTDNFVDITGLTASITPSSTNSKILVSVAVVGGHQSTADRSQLYQLTRDGSLINVGDAAGNRSQISFATGNGSSGRSMFTGSTVFLDSPSSTSALTYAVKIGDEIGSASTVYVNRSQLDDDTVISGRAVSAITLMEVAG